MNIAWTQLCNDTAGVLRRAAGGESVQITVDGEAAAELRPLPERRAHWTSSARLVERLVRSQADPALSGELRTLSGVDEDLGPLE